ncbi:MAG: putative peptidoglycan glycosyltransferase FtsW [Patescibacteria group bacterium]|nr:putative peptidoglycan glycosyltransferase FtsW [Patescibacteria group bacterium]
MIRGLKIKKGNPPDYILLTTIILLTVFGLIMLSSASSDLGKIKFNNTFYYLKHQIYYGLSLGIIGFLIGYFVPYKKWQSAAIYLLLVSIAGLILVFTPIGMHSGGAVRWINIGQISIQPAELLKLTFIIYLAAWLSKKKSRSVSFDEGFIPLIIMAGVIAVLIALQPATTTIFIIMTASLIVYFVSGTRLRYIAGIVFLGIFGLAVIVLNTPYRTQRVMNYINNKSVDTQSSGYHRNQALMAIGSGGAFGVGFGQSTTKYKFLPEPIGDSIFAVIAEEFGFIGSIILISTFILLVVRGFIVAKNCRDQFGRLMTVGFISIIAIQTFVNIGAISGLLPLTGVPLPFISYGGTALAIFLTMGGIIVNISKYS